MTVFAYSVRLTLRLTEAAGKDNCGEDAVDRYRISNGDGFGEIRISWDRAKIPLTGKQAAERLKNRAAAHRLLRR